MILPKKFISARHFIGFSDIRAPCTRGLILRVTILAKWLCHLNDLTVGETVAPACFARFIYAKLFARYVKPPFSVLCIHFLFY